MTLLPVSCTKAQSEQADGDDDNHNDPFLDILSASTIQYETVSRQTQWQLHQSAQSCVNSSLLELVVPLAAEPLGALDADELGAEPPLFVPDPPPCSEAPLSLPQLLVYHVLMAVLSDGLEQVPAHMVVNAPPDWVQTVWQKQDQAWSESLLPPLQLDCADVRTGQVCAHEGRLPLPCVSSCAVAVEARRMVATMLRSCIVLSNLWNASGRAQSSRSARSRQEMALSTPMSCRMGEVSDRTLQ